jgi:hypothetical protein
MDLGKEGDVAMACDVAADRTLTNCEVVSEAPKAMGFGAAALLMSPLYKMKDQTPVGTRVTLPIFFRFDSPQRDLSRALSRRKPLRQPTNTQIEQARPAGLAGLGSVTLRCHVKSGDLAKDTEKGELYDCKSVREEPAKLGLSNAALSMAALFQYDPAAVPPLDPKQVVDLDIVWQAKPAN